MSAAEDQTAQTDSKDAAANDLIYRMDSWLNLVTGLGRAGRDKTAHTTFTRPRHFLRVELDDLYRSDAIFRRIVDTLPADMVRQWMQLNISTEVEEGEDPLDPAEANRIKAGVQNKLKKLEARKKIKQALKWARLYGGSLIVIGLDDDEDDLSEPVNEDAISDVFWLRVLTRFQATPGVIERDKESPFFGEPRDYTLHAFEEDGTAITVHASRVMRFDGVDLPPGVAKQDGTTISLRRESAGAWNDSVAVSVFDALKDFQISYRATTTMIHDFSQAVWGIPGYHEMVASNQEELIKRKMLLQDFARGVTNAVLVDSTLDETFTRESIQAGGLPDLLDRQALRLSASAGMSMTLLFGVAPKGFANEDKTGEANWDDVVQADQEEQLRSPLERLVGYLLKADEGPSGGVEPKSWEVDFLSLTQLTDLQRAEQYAKNAEGDSKYVAMEILTPEEVATSRFTAEGYQLDINLDQKKREEFANGEMLGLEDPTAGEFLEKGEEAANERPSTGVFDPAHLLAVCQLVQKVEAGSIPREAGIQILMSMLLIKEEEAKKMLGPAGVKDPNAPTPPGFPGGSPAALGPQPPGAPQPPAPPVPPPPPGSGGDDDE